MHLERRPAYVATLAPDPNPWPSIRTHPQVMSDGLFDMRMHDASDGSGPFQRGAEAGWTMLATTDEREARAAFNALGQVNSGAAALLHDDGVWLVESQARWDREAATTRRLPFMVTLDDELNGVERAQVQRRNPLLVAARDEDQVVTWKPRPVSDDPFGGPPLVPSTERFRTPVVAERPPVPAALSSDRPVARVEARHPSDSSRRVRTSLFAETEDHVAWVGDDPVGAIAGARAIANQFSMDVAIWREAGGDYWLAPMYPRDRHLPASPTFEPNSVLRTEHDELQAIVGPQHAYDFHGMLDMSGPDDVEDSYIRPNDPRYG